MEGSGVEEEQIQGNNFHISTSPSKLCLRHLNTRGIGVNFAKEAKREEILVIGAWNAMYGYAIQVTWTQTASISGMITRDRLYMYVPSKIHISIIWIQKYESMHGTMVSTNIHVALYGIHFPIF